MEGATTEDLITRIRWLEEELRAAREPANGRRADSPETDLVRRAHIFDIVLSNLPDLICTFDLRGRFTYANAALLCVWQRSLAEIIGKNTYDLNYPPDLAARIQAEVEAVIAEQKPVRNATPFTGPGGEERVYEYIFSPVLAGDRALVEVTCTARDITERLRMEKEAVASGQRLQQFLAQAPVPIIVFRGRNFVVELANDHYRALLKGRELLGRPFAEVVPELGREVWDVFNRVLDTGEQFVAYEWLIPYDADGDGAVEDHWFNVVYHPLREVDGPVTGFIAVLADVTPQVMARKELERVNRELEEFAYVASHDLQEPLRMVNIYTQLLLRRHVPAESEARQYGETISQGVKRMESLLQDLLTYSRAVQRDANPIGSASLSDALGDALSVLAGRIEEQKATITAGLLPVVRGDLTQLAHVFQNLVSNALKYCRKDCPPAVNISAALSGDHWVVCVRDNGIGFDPRYGEHIFGLFKRLHKDEYPGTGLGLAICQRIVERFGGRMWAQSTPGEGSAFYFCLPTAAAQ